MPVYEYLCESCGPFTEMRSMAEYDRPQDCPDCGHSAPRVILTAPNFSSMSREKRTAYATNERSAHEPKLSSKTKGHASGCSCCTGKSSRLVRYGKGGSKSFPTTRPWMISH